MAEVVGLVLAVASIIVPAYEGYQKCNTAIAEARNFPRNFRIFKQSLLIQKGIFNNECELLLKEFVLDSSTLQKMLRDQNHKQWKDSDFQSAFCDHLGGGSLDDKLIPFKVIRETLDKITDEVLELERGVESGSNLVSCGIIPTRVGCLPTVLIIPGNQSNYALSLSFTATQESRAKIRLGVIKESKAREFGRHTEKTKPRPVSAAEPAISRGSESKTQDHTAD